MRKRKLSSFDRLDRNFILNVLNNSLNISLAIKNLGYVSDSGSYRRLLREWISRENYYFVEGKKPFRGSRKLKNSLVSAQGWRCQSCQLSTWLDQPIPLELEHIDGDRSNNAIDNLKLLCANCHAQTVTFRGKNAVIRRKAGLPVLRRS